VEVVLLVLLGRRVAAALLGDDVEQDRAGDPLGVVDGLLQGGQVVAVDRPLAPSLTRLAASTMPSPTSGTRPNVSSTPFFRAS
jgi:hypothetical protein